MADVTPIRLNKKKFSDFNLITQQDLDNSITSTFLVGYKQQQPINSNTRLNVASLVNAVTNRVIAEGGINTDGGNNNNPSQSPSPSLPSQIETQTALIAGSDYNTFSSGERGITMVTKNNKKVCVIDTKQFGDYIQFESIPNTALNLNQSVTFEDNTTTATTFDICLANTTLGQCFKVYLPNFSPQRGRYALRIWRNDPYVAETKTIDTAILAAQPVTVFLSDTNLMMVNNCDWFVKFLVLGIVKNGIIVNLTRTQEVTNLFDNDEVAGE